jgi:hypothetical protein
LPGKIGTPQSCTLSGLYCPAGSQTPTCNSSGQWVAGTCSAPYKYYGNGKPSCVSGPCGANQCVTIPSTGTNGPIPIQVTSTQPLVCGYSSPNTYSLWAINPKSPSQKAPLFQCALPPGTSLNASFDPTLIGLGSVGAVPYGNIFLEFTDCNGVQLGAFGGSPAFSYCGP